MQVGDSVLVLGLRGREFRRRPANHHFTYRRRRRRLRCQRHTIEEEEKFAQGSVKGTGALTSNVGVENFAIEEFRSFEIFFAKGWVIGTRGL